MRGEVVPALVDPIAQPVPLAEQGLVRDLDGRRARRGVAIEGEEPVARERVDGALQGDDVDVERGELRGGDPTPADHRVGDRGDAEEQLADGLLLGTVEAGVEGLGAACHRLAHAAHALVGGEVEDRAGALVEQLGERVLEERKRVRLPGHVGDEPRHQARFDPHVELVGRLGGGQLEIVRDPSG